MESLLLHRSVRRAKISLKYFQVVEKICEKNSPRKMPVGWGFGRDLICCSVFSLWRKSGSLLQVCVLFHTKNRHLLSMDFWIWAASFLMHENMEYFIPFFFYICSSCTSMSFMSLTVSCGDPPRHLLPIDMVAMAVLLGEYIPIIKPHLVRTYLTRDIKIL